MTASRLERVTAIVPVKGLRDGKSRLNQTIEPGERAELVLTTLRTVLAALTVPPISSRIVVSPDRGVLHAARLAGAIGLAQVEQAADALNGALEQARQYALANVPQAILVVLGDLPLLAPADIETMIALATHEAMAIIAPDRHETGTNALLLQPPTALPFAFGVASCQRHLALANQLGLPATLYQTPGLAFDLDTPTDLRELAARRSEYARLNARDVAHYCSRV